MNISVFMHHDGGMTARLLPISGLRLSKGISLRTSRSAPFFAALARLGVPPDLLTAIAVPAPEA
jgi:hypothetical protein